MTAIESINARTALIQSLHTLIAEAKAIGHTHGDIAFDQLLCAVGSATQDLDRVKQDAFVKALAFYAHPTHSGKAPEPYLGSAFKRRYTDDEFAALPGDRGFATIRDMAVHNARVEAGAYNNKNTRKVALPHREPKFKVGDMVVCLFMGDRKPHAIASVYWQDNTGFGAPSGWKVSIPGISAEDTYFKLATDETAPAAK